MVMTVMMVWGERGGVEASDNRCPSYNQNKPWLRNSHKNSKTVFILQLNVILINLLSVFQYNVFLFGREKHILIPYDIRRCQFSG